MMGTVQSLYKKELTEVGPVSTVPDFKVVIKVDTENLTAAEDILFSK